MSKIIVVPHGIVHLVESEAECPYCERHIPFDEIEPKLMRMKNAYIRMKCKCKRFIGITSNFKGDFIAFKLQGAKSGHN